MVQIARWMRKSNAAVLYIQERVNSAGLGWSNPAHSPGNPIK